MKHRFDLSAPGMGRRHSRTPLYSLDREEPYRPSLVAWIELPEGLVVGQDVVMPEDVAAAVVHVLREALSQPAAGAPRRPDAIRVVDSVIAAQVRAAVHGTIPVTIAPTAELDGPARPTARVDAARGRARKLLRRGARVRSPRSNACSRRYVRCSR